MPSRSWVERQQQAATRNGPGSGSKAAGWRGTGGGSGGSLHRAAASEDPGRFGPGGGPKAAGGRRSSGSSDSGLHRGAGRENAPRNRQRQSPGAEAPRSCSRPQPSALAFDALLLSSFHSTVAAAGIDSSSWLHSGSQPSGGGGDEDEVSSGAPALGLPSPSRQGPSSPTALLLPHLSSAEATSWLLSSSPSDSPNLASSPSLTVSCSISLTGPTPAAEPLAAVAGAAGTAGEAQPGSPVSLQPLPPLGRHPPAALGASPERPASGSSTPQAPPAGGQQDLSPLAAALAAALSPGAGWQGSGASSLQQQQQQQPGDLSATLQRLRRHSSPFLSRDCSRVDVFCPDRYTRWTQQRGEEEEGDGAESSGSALGGHLFGEACLPGASGGGGRGLRRVLGTALRWVSGHYRLASHPIELTPSEQASYGSCTSSLAGTPPASPSPANSRFFTPASGGSSGGRGGSGAAPLRTLSTGPGGTASGGRPAPAAAASLASPGPAPRHLHYSPEGGGGAAGDGGSSCGSGGSSSGTPTAVRWRRAGEPGSCGSRGGPTAAASPGGAAPGSAGRSRPVALLAHLTHEQQDWQLQPGGSWSPGGGSEPEGSDSQLYQSPPCCPSPPASGSAASAATAGVEADGGSVERLRQQERWLGSRPSGGRSIAS